jgi:hypothetical protein
MSSRREQKEQAKARRLELEQQARAAAARRRRRQTAGIAATVALGLAGAVAAVATDGSAGGQTDPLPPVPIRVGPLASLGRLLAAPAPGALGPEGVPIPPAARLASPAAGGHGGAVDGISCLAGEQLLFHIHAHVTVFIDGVARQIPGGIGVVDPRAQDTPAGPFVVGAGCFYWLHTHAADGIVHIESPVRRIYTLGDFFDVWGEPLGPTAIGPYRGSVTAIYNGRRYLGNPRSIPLNRHAQIQLELGRPLVAPKLIVFPSGL